MSKFTSISGTTPTVYRLEKGKAKKVAPSPPSLSDLTNIVLRESRNRVSDVLEMETPYGAKLEGPMLELLKKQNVFFMDTPTPFPGAKWDTLSLTWSFSADDKKEVELARSASQAVVDIVMRKRAATTLELFVYVQEFFQSLPFYGKGTARLWALRSEWLRETVHENPMTKEVGATVSITYAIGEDPERQSGIDTTTWFFSAVGDPTNFDYSELATKGFGDPDADDEDDDSDTPIVVGE